MHVTLGRGGFMSEKSGPNLTSMINALTEDISALVRGHIELAKREIQESVVNLAKSSAYFMVAISMAHLASIFLLVTLGFGLVAAGLPEWAAFFIVSVLLVAGTIGFLVAGKKRLQRLKSATRTIDAFSETADTLRSLQDFQD